LLFAVGKNNIRSANMAATISSTQRDRVWVDIHDPQEVRFWTEQFQCTSNELKKAVTAVGIMASKIEHWLDGRVSHGVDAPSLRSLSASSAHQPRM
jgi:hypothetical protein